MVPPLTAVTGSRRSALARPAASAAKALLSERAAPSKAGPTSPPPHLAQLELAFVTEDDFEDFHRAVQRGFQEEMPAEAVEADRPLLESGRFFGYRVGQRHNASSAARRSWRPSSAQVSNSSAAP